MENKILAIYNLNDINEYVTTRADDTYLTISEMFNAITTASGTDIPFDSTFFTTNASLLNEVTKMAFLQLINNVIAEVDCEELETSYYITSAPAVSDMAENGYFDDFARKLSYFMQSSTNFIERINFYETYKSQFMTDKVIDEVSHSGSDKNVRDTDTTHNSKYNNTPQETGDWSGDGYVNEVTTGSATDDTTVTTTYGHKITTNKTDLVTKRLAEADKAIKNIYSEWLGYFRYVCFID